MRKKILITGANGFVGKHLIEKLECNFELYAIDFQVVKDIAAERSFVCNISNFDKIKEIFTSIKPDILIHLAAIVHKNNADTSEENYNFINFECSKFLFDQCKIHNTKIIFSSTIEVYGENELNCIDEHSICNPNSFYSISKYKAEQYLASLTGVEYSILRLTPLYGKNFTLNIDKRVYLIKNKVAYYFKAGSYTFDFCSINNVKDFIEFICKNKFENKVYLLADENSICIREIINLKKKNENLKYVLKLPYFLCSFMISIIEFVGKKVKKKDFYLSKRNFDKLFLSKQYRCTNLEGFEFNWDIERTLYGD